MLKCDECPCSKDERRLLRHHWERHHRLGPRPQPQLLCDLCPLRTDSRQALVKHHIARHASEEVKLQARTLRGPLPLQRRREKIRCDACLKDLRRFLLAAHIAAIHRRIPPSFRHKRLRCDLCPESFTDRSLWLHWTLIHRGIDPRPQRPVKGLRCDDCGERLKPMAFHLHHLRHHSRSPAAQRAAQELRRQLLAAKQARQRTEEEAVACDDCPPGSRLVKPHRLFHHFGEQHVPGSRSRPKPTLRIYVCDVCSQEMRELRTLVNHMALRHPRQAPMEAAPKGPTKEPRVCDVCGIEKKSTTGNFYGHWQRMHSQLAFSRTIPPSPSHRKVACDECGRQVGLNQLGLHWRLCHSLRPPPRTTPNPNARCDECRMAYRVGAVFKHWLSRHSGRRGGPELAALREKERRKTMAVCDLCGLRRPKHKLLAGGHFQSCSPSM